ncbi:hypothetical protein [Streptomyces sp. NPDC017941]|uniref:scabin-related ADP-ribosyltransferase n=1 Tax=Streptomyces sp. NPDC017941 TaxID=3365018 RepID=UPI0037A58CF4
MAGATPVLVHNSGGACPLYRSDTRGPDEIFQSGFEPRGDNMDLLEHASGYSRDSGYVATTTSKGIRFRMKGRLQFQGGLIRAASLLAGFETEPGFRTPTMAGDDCGGVGSNCDQDKRGEGERFAPGFYAAFDSSDEID